MTHFLAIWRTWIVPAYVVVVVTLTLVAVVSGWHV